jgi:uncharacterized protein
VDKEQAQYWLEKAAAIGDRQAKQELREASPENISTTSPYLQLELATLTSYQEKFAPSNNNNYEGNYMGHIVYYDWSRRYVSDIQPLRLRLTKTGQGYQGDWQEGEGLTTSIALTTKGGQLVFDSGCAYQRTNHYSGRQPEPWLFNSAQLALGFYADSVVLNGSVQFYSAARREPGKPVQVILKRAMGQTGTTHQLAMRLLPNPTSGQAAVQFTLDASAHVTISITTQDGKLLFTSDKSQLPKGTYTYPLPVAAYKAGSYIVKVTANNSTTATATLVKQ